MVLYRPMGIEELGLIYDAGLRAFPPRLPDQPIFYPVLNRGYAEQIARDWNTRHGSMAGYVTRFEIADDHVSRYERQVVGGREHEELWVPAEELKEFNTAILSPIETIDWFFGEGFRGSIPRSGSLAGLDARAQIDELRSALEDHRENFTDLLAGNARTIFLHVPYWESIAPGTDSGRVSVTAEIRRQWPGPLPLPGREPA